MKITSFIVAIILALIPWGWPMAWLMPDWVLMVCLFWAIVPTQGITLSAPFVVGLMMDIAQGTLLGTHALIYVLIAFLGMRLQARFAFYAPLQQICLVGLLATIATVLKAFLMIYNAPMTLHVYYWLSIVLTMLTWPVLYYLIRHTNSARIR